MSAQSMAALARANDVKAERRLVKGEIRDGLLSVGAALRHPAVQKMSVYDLLQAQHGWGSTHRSEGQRAMQLLDGLHISPYRPVESLTGRQRALLRDAL